VLESIEAIHNMAAADGSKTLVVFQPSKESVYAHFLGKDAPDPGAPLRDALGERGIETLDLRPAFRAAAEKRQQLFYANDGHPNTLGYAVTARTVADYIKGKGLLD